MISFLRGIYRNSGNIAFSLNGHPLQQRLNFHSVAILRCEAKQEENLDQNQSGVVSAEDLLKKQKKDRTQLIPVETSIRYLKSSAYKQTYGDQFVWELYRRNHKGALPPRKTRKTCIRKGVISTGNPCPICRDEYLVLNERNIELLQQFLSPYTGKILSYSKTGLCQKKYFQLTVAVERAWDMGLITFDVPFREFDLKEYYGEALNNPQKL